MQERDNRAYGKGKLKPEGYENQNTQDAQAERD
jgi:hypothetical protein